MGKDSALSLIDDINRRANEEAAQARLGGAQEHLAELEAKRKESEQYRNPAYAQFWAKRRSQVLLLRAAIAP